MNIMLEMLVATEKIHRPLQNSLSLGFEEAIGFVGLMLDAAVLTWRITILMWTLIWTMASP